MRTRDCYLMWHSSLWWSSFYWPSYKVNWCDEVVLLWLPSLTGLIIDSFGELREKEKSTKEDMKVCGEQTLANYKCVSFLYLAKVLHLWNIQRTIWPVSWRIWKPHKEWTWNGWLHVWAFCGLFQHTQAILSEIGVNLMCFFLLCNKYKQKSKKTTVIIYTCRYSSGL